MELTPAGRLVVWLATCLMVVGLLFSNGLIVMSATAIFVYLLFEGIALRRGVEVFKHSIKLETCPRTIETTVDRRILVETTLQNDSHLGFRIVDLSRMPPPEIREETHDSGPSLSPWGEQRIETFLEAKIPGRFEMRKLTIILEQRSRLLRQSVGFVDEVTLTAWPKVSQLGTSLDASVLYDLSVDPVRRGVGTDFAGVRPWNLLDDFRTIDWKATARTGKLMTKDFYVEKDPTIMLLIDHSSSMKAVRSGGPLLNALICEVANFLAIPRLATSAMGFISYDERMIIANIEPSPGRENKERILRTFLETANLASATPQFLRQETRPHAVLARETHLLERELIFSDKIKPLWERFRSFADLVLPFCRKAISYHLLKLRRQGVFKAFETICNLSEPVLVIVISDGKTNLDGLYEGARYATMFKHRVVISILSHPEKPNKIEPPLGLREIGVRITECVPRELWKVVSAEIFAMSQARSTSFGRVIRQL